MHLLEGNWWLIGWRGALFLCVLASCAYSLIALVAWLAWMKDRRRQRAFGLSFVPPVTIFKPVLGLDAQAYECFASFCQQDYPAFQLIFGVQDKYDPVLPMIERLRADFPHHDMAVVVDCTSHGYNRKVSNLINMFSAAKHDVFVIADSDIRVTPDYLRRVVAPLQQAETGMVTCLYRGVNAKTFASLLENLGIAATFGPEVCTARLLEGVKFALGSTMALRRETLAQTGGFNALADYLADDYVLGNAIAERLKLKVVLSDYVVEHIASPDDFAAMFNHQLRWARSVRISRGKGYLGLILTYGTVTASLLALSCGFDSWALWLLVLTLALRALHAVLIGVIGMNDRALARWFWLIPLRDWLGFVVWLAGFWGREILWRGERLRVLSDGKMKKAKQKVASNR